MFDNVSGDGILLRMASALSGSVSINFSACNSSDETELLLEQEEKHRIQISRKYKIIFRGLLVICVYLVAEYIAFF